MSDERYQPPASALQDPPKPPRPAVLAVGIGLAVDILGTLIVGSMLSVGFLMYWASSGMNQAQIEAAMSNPSMSSGPFLAGTLAGGACSVLGGYVCQRLTRQPGYRRGWVLGGLSAVLGLLMAGDGYSLAQHIGLNALTVACVLGGVRLGQPRLAA